MAVETAVSEPGSPHQPGRPASRDSVAQNWALAARVCARVFWPFLLLDLRMGRFTASTTFWLEHRNV